MDKYYRNTMLKLFKVYGGWHVAAGSIDDVKGLAMKRGNDEPSDNDIELVEHNCTVIERVCETYEEVCKTNNEEIDSLKSRLNEITEAIPKLKNPERMHCPDNQVSQVNAGEANSGTNQDYQALLVNLKGYFYDNLEEGEKIDNQKIHEMILDFESTL